MKIEGMDASFRTPANGTSPQVKPDLPVKPAAPIEEKDTGSPAVSEAFIRGAVDKVNQSMRQNNRSLEFKIHEKTNEIIVKIIDTDTKEVIREIPSEKILDMFANMLELAGLIVDERR